MPVWRLAPSQVIANVSEATVHAYAVRTDYQFTLGTWSERRFNFPNKAPQIARKQFRMHWIKQGLMMEMSHGILL